MALKDGDVVRFDYTLWVDGKPVETSQEEVAKREGIHRPGRRYRPLTISLGGSQIIPGLESHIRSHGEVGKAVKAELAPAEAYGERSADKVRDVPMAQFRKQKVEPKVGMQLNLEGQQGVVTRVAGGRVRVDLNHDLAGKPLTYEYTVREVVADDKAKVDAVLENLFQPGSFKVAVDDRAVTLEVPEAAKFDQNWMMAKFRVVSELRAATQKRKEVRLVEVFPISTDEPGHEGHGHGPGEGH
ncbi:MAG TPA: FKBP-type peptidyl-prolyl cis-trans isomerase [Candidatus Thermoplasmatota archaeon]|nr:FKBP-type peptidyl-prolyl cis-trans isomerase [Candidatus Thermoplasmatota archaeon]